LIYFPLKTQREKRKGSKRTNEKKISVNRNRKEEYRENKETQKEAHPL